MYLGSYQGRLLPSPPSYEVFGQAVQPVPCWSFEFSWEVFNGMKVIAAGHMNVENEVFDPYRGVCGAII